MMMVRKGKPDEGGEKTVSFHYKHTFVNLTSISDGSVYQ